MSTQSVSFQNDIMPLFNQYKANMIWRFDITNYEVVKDNAQMIYDRISNQGDSGYMPPPPFDPFTPQQIAMFKAWMDEGFPP
ncbi:MAG: hypothetical protein L0229_02680 [Blastocatellia bacterium]|nr:hypothetical protein [Blastocatellia bacterium]